MASAYQGRICYSTGTEDHDLHEERSLIFPVTTLPRYRDPIMGNTLSREEKSLKDVRDSCKRYKIYQSVSRFLAIKNSSRELITVRNTPPRKRHDIEVHPTFNHYDVLLLRHPAPWASLRHTPIHDSPIPQPALSFAFSSISFLFKLAFAHHRSRLNLLLTTLVRLHLLRCYL